MKGLPMGRSTVYFERRYKESCCDRYNPGLAMPDMFDEERCYQAGAGQVAYFDVPPEYAEEEAGQMRDVADIVAVYPATTAYGRASHGRYRQLVAPYYTASVFPVKKYNKAH